MTDTALVLAWHVHQPAFVPDDELRDRITESYDPLLAMHEQMEVPFCLNVTGGLLERIAELSPDTVARISDLADRGLLEVLASGYQHPLFPLLTYERARDQIARDIEAKEEFLSTRPVGFWPPDLGWAQWLVPLLSEFGIEWSIVDSTALVESNSLPHWETRSTDAGEVLSPDIESITFHREIDRPYQVTLCDSSIDILVRNHHRSVELGDNGDGVLHTPENMSEFVTSLSREHGQSESVVTIGGDGERINAETARVYRQFLDNVGSDNSGVTCHTGSQSILNRLERKGPPCRFLAASTFQFDLNPWLQTMDDMTLFRFVQHTRRQVKLLAVLCDLTNGSVKDAEKALDRARDHLLVAEDSGHWFWNYTRRTRMHGYERTLMAYRAAERGIKAVTDNGGRVDSAGDQRGRDR